MCWMMVKEAGKKIPIDYMDKAQAHNEDGYGVSWYEGNMVQTYRTFDYDTFKRVVLALEDKSLVIHLRYATKGSKDYSNIHPFDIPSGVMFHNGTMNKVSTTGTASDSKSLANTITECDYNFIEDILPLIKHYVDDKINRLVFFEDNGMITIVNKHLGIEEDGIWYSNDYHLKDDKWCRFGSNKSSCSPIKEEVYDLDIISDAVSEEPKHKVFVYGTLKRGYGNNRLLKEAVFLGTAQTKEKWAMISNYSKTFPYLIEENEAGHNVQGEVYYVTDTELKSLDMLEGTPHHYRRNKITVEYKDDKTDEEVYVYVKAFTPTNYAKDNVLLYTWTR